MMPPILTGRRWTMFQRLFLVGLAQAAIALACSGLLAMVLTGNLAPPTLLPVAGLILAAAATVALRRFEAAEAERLGQNYVMDVRLKLFEATLHDGGRRQRHGIAMARMITDLTSVKNWVSLGLSRVLVGALSLAGGIAALWVSSPGLAAWGTGLVLAVILTAAALSRPLHDRIRTARRYRGRLAARVGELTRASDTLVQCGAVASESKRLRRMSRHMGDALAERRGFVGLMQGLPEMIVPLAAALFVIAAMTNPALASHQPAVALLILAFLAQPLRDLIGAVDYRIMYNESSRRLAPLLAELDRAADPVPASAVVTTTPVILLELGGEPTTGRPAVKAADIAGGPVPLRLVTAETPPSPVLASDAERSTGPTTSRHVAVSGDVTALAFLDMAEGTALLRAIAGLGRDPAGWQVIVDGEPIAIWPADLRRQRVKLVSSRLPLLRRNVERNLRDLVPGATAERIGSVFAEMGLSDDPELARIGKRKLDELGRGLSASLDARLRLARAVLAEPTVIVTDDRTFLYDEPARLALERAVTWLGITALVAIQAGVAVPPGWRVVGPTAVVGMGPPAASPDAEADRRTRGLNLGNDL